MSEVLLQVICSMTAPLIALFDSREFLRACRGWMTDPLCSFSCALAEVAWSGAEGWTQLVFSLVALQNLIAESAL